ncbi:beta/gamma crystallin-related protein [Rhodoferax sp.]|uniref:beta/gamma crystallin-related protein n=1 Tax=Rhodoferax sp. TaxID=50421 RepID=UPI002776894D|nr:beta/gamma crystallin-related protein [Rhodoferax sp.]
MNAFLKTALAVSAVAMAAHAAAQVTFYEHDDFQGRSFTTEQQVNNFGRIGFNDRASSVMVLRNRWEVCEDAQFGGRCVVLRPGQYASLGAMGLNDRVSSVRAVGRRVNFDEDRYAPPPIAPAYDSRRRGTERLYEAEVTSVRGVFGPPQQRCWMEREQVVQEQRGGANVPGAIAGALIGGILGHQVGGGTGKDIATAGGVIAGAAVGSNIGRDGGQRTYSQDVQRCSTETNQGRPHHWEVTYNFRGQEHRIQMTTPPGSSVTVNRRGEPRG